MQRYYKQIHDMTPLSEQEMNAHLAEESRVSAGWGAGRWRAQGCGAGCGAQAGLDSAGLQALAPLPACTEVPERVQHQCRHGRDLQIRQEVPRAGELPPRSSGRACSLAGRLGDGCQGRCPLCVSRAGGRRGDAGTVSSRPELPPTPVPQIMAALEANPTARRTQLQHKFEQVVALMEDNIYECYSEA